MNINAKRKKETAAIWNEKIVKSSIKNFKQQMKEEAVRLNMRLDSSKAKENANASAATEKYSEDSFGGYVVSRQSVGGAEDDHVVHERDLVEKTDGQIAHRVRAYSKSAGLARTKSTFSENLSLADSQQTGRPTTGSSLTLIEKIIRSNVNSSANLRNNVALQKGIIPANATTATNGTNSPATVTKSLLLSKGNLKKNNGNPTDIVSRGRIRQVTKGNKKRELIDSKLGSNSTQWIREEDSEGNVKMSLKDPLPLYGSKKRFVVAHTHWPASIKCIQDQPDTQQMSDNSMKSARREKYYSPESAVDLSNVNKRNEKIGNMIVGCEKGRMMASFQDNHNTVNQVDYSNNDVLWEGGVETYPRTVYVCENGASFKKSRVGSYVKGYRGSDHGKDLKPYYTLKGPGDLTLVFESRFESGNLLKAIQTARFEYALMLKSDLNTNKPCTQWYYFQVKNMRANIEYKFNIINYVKSDSLYNSGLKPLLYSERANRSCNDTGRVAKGPEEDSDGKASKEDGALGSVNSGREGKQQSKSGWVRIGNNIEYQKNALTYSSLLNFGNDSESVSLMYPMTREVGEAQDRIAPPLKKDGGSEKSSVQTELLKCGSGSCSSLGRSLPDSSSPLMPTRSCLKSSSSGLLGGYKVNSNVGRPNSASISEVAQIKRTPLLLVDEDTTKSSPGKFASSPYNSKNSNPKPEKAPSQSGAPLNSEAPQNTAVNGKSFYTLSFMAKFPHSNDVCYLSHCYPYTYSQLQEDLCMMINDPVKSQYVKHKVLCTTLANNNLDMLTITTFTSDMYQMNDRRGIVITGRVHPGESNSSWVVKGVIDFLTSSSPDAKILRDNFIFKIVPMLNPDGVILGNTRCSLAGVDLNRCWLRPLRTQHPTIFYTKQMIRKFKMNREITMYCDFHGHSRKHNVFMYGCENGPSSVNSHWKFQERVFPRMLSWNSKQRFSYTDCNFAVQKCKEGTARVVMWREMNILNSFTMESSYAGWSSKKCEGSHFGIPDLLSMGEEFCDTILDYCDPVPGKVEFILNKIESDFRDNRLSNVPPNYEISDASSFGSDDEEEENAELHESESEWIKDQNCLDHSRSDDLRSQFVGDGSIPVRVDRHTERENIGLAMQISHFTSPSMNDTLLTDSDESIDKEEKESVGMAETSKLTGITLKEFDRRSLISVSGSTCGSVKSSTKPNKQTSISGAKSRASSASSKIIRGAPTNTETRLQKRAEIQKKSWSKDKDAASESQRDSHHIYNALSCREEKQPLTGVIPDLRTASSLDRACHVDRTGKQSHDLSFLENEDHFVKELMGMIRHKKNEGVEVYDNKKQGLVSLSESLLRKFEPSLKSSGFSPGVPNSQKPNSQKPKHVVCQNLRKVFSEGKTVNIDQSKDLINMNTCILREEERLPDRKVNLEKDLDRTQTDGLRVMLGSRDKEENKDEVMKKLTISNAIEETVKELELQKVPQKPICKPSINEVQATMSLTAWDCVDYTGLGKSYSSRKSSSGTVMKGITIPTAKTTSK